jgi:hypothetical protein
MLTIAGGILLAYGIFVGAWAVVYLGFSILAIPFRIAEWRKLKREKRTPVRHYYEELPDHLGGSDGW